jgi:hypothetical protein
MLLSDALQVQFPLDSTGAQLTPFIRIMFCA